MSHIRREVLALAALGEPLPDPDAAHIAQCQHCRERLAAFERAVADPGEVGPPPGEVDYDPVRRRVREPAPPSRQRWTGRRLAAGVGVLALLAGASAVTAVLMRPDPPRVVAEVTLEGLGGAPPGTARILEGPEGRSVVVDVDAALPPTDGFYELWLLDADPPTGLVSLGVVEPGRPQPLPDEVDVTAFPVVDVSREPADGDPAHSGDSLLRGRLAATG